MALPIGIEELLTTQRVESHRKEYKEGWNPDAVMRTVCAFANDYDNVYGGYIVIGLKTKDGLPDISESEGIREDGFDSLQRKIYECSHLMRPFYVPEISVESYAGKRLLVIYAPPGVDRPYSIPDRVTSEKSPRHIYIRVGSSSVQAGDGQIRELYEMASFIPYDERPCYRIEASDLSKELMREHLRRVGSSLYAQSSAMDAMTIADKMSLLSGPSEARAPKNVAALMFSEKANDAFPEAKIEISIIPDPTGKNMDVKLFGGPIQYQLESALRYIQNEVIREKIIKVPGQATALHIFNYPYAAIEEILPNAVYHRDYRIHEPISVTVTPEYLEVKSFPGFDASIKAEDIAKGVIKSNCPYRNRSIGNYLKELGLTEGKNTGVPTMLEACRINGSLPPEFLMDDERSSLRVRLYAHEAFAPEKGTRISSGNRSREEISSEILAILANGPKSLLEISKRMGYKSVPKNLKEEVEALLKRGSVAREGRGKGTLYSLGVRR